MLKTTRALILAISTMLHRNKQAIITVEGMSIGGRLDKFCRTGTCKIGMTNLSLLQQQRLNSVGEKFPQKLLLLSTCSHPTSTLTWLRVLTLNLRGSAPCECACGSLQ